MVIDLHTHAFQSGLKGFCCALAVEAGQHHAGNIQTQLPENADQTDHIPIIGDAQIPTDLILFDICRIDGNHHLHLLLQLQQHPQLAVRLKARQNSGCMIVIKQLTAEFQIQLAAEESQPLTDMGRLQLQVFIVVVSNFYHGNASFIKITC